jgi:hypothetical protein
MGMRRTGRQGDRTLLVTLKGWAGQLCTGRPTSTHAKRERNGTKRPLAPTISETKLHKQLPTELTATIAQDCNY